MGRKNLEPVCRDKARRRQSARHAGTRWSYRAGRRLSFCCREKAIDDPSQSPAIEAEVRGRSSSELMHPVGRRRRLFPPLNRRAKHQVNIPCGSPTFKMKDFRIELYQPRLWVKEARDAGVRKAPPFAPGCGFDCPYSEDGQPDDVSAQVGAGNRLKDFLLDFGGPPKTDSSRRVEEQEEADFSDVLVELELERAKVIRQAGDREFSLRRAGRREPDE